MLNVSYGNQLDVEYSKKDIVDKINSFFGYQFIKNIKTVLIDEKINISNKDPSVDIGNRKLDKKIDSIDNLKLKKKFEKLAKEFMKKNT